MIMDVLPGKQQNNEDHLSGPAVSSVAPIRVARNVTSDRHHGDYHVPENLHGHRIIQSLRESRFFVLCY